VGSIGLRNDILAIHLAASLLMIFMAVASSIWEEAQRLHRTVVVITLHITQRAYLHQTCFGSCKSASHHVKEVTRRRRR
jgi:hypothetical protein